MTELLLEQAKPTGTIDQIFEIDCVADDKLRQSQIDSAVARNLPRVHWRKKHKGKLAIVASGPSVTDYVDILKNWDGEIWGINRAFEWMRHREIKPTAFVGGDPEWFLKECLPNIPQDATYYLASQTHPCVFDHLKDRNVKLWFMADSQIRQPFGATEVHGGSTLLSRAPNLGYILGYRDVHVFGGDSSFTHKTHVHGGELPPNWVPAEVAGVVYKTTRPMMSQACEFVEQMVEWSRGKDPLAVTIYGEGLMPALVADAMNSGNYERYMMEVDGR